MEKFSSEFTAGKQTRFARTWCRTTLLPHARITLCVRDLTSTSLVAGVAAVLPAWAPCSWFQLSHKTNQRTPRNPCETLKGKLCSEEPCTFLPCCGGGAGAVAALGCALLTACSSQPCDPSWSPTALSPRASPRQSPLCLQCQALC